MPAVSEPTYAFQLMRPVLRALRSTRGFPTFFIDQLEAENEPTARIPVRAAQKLFAGSVELTGNPDLGLEAAQVTEVGDYEVVEYAAASAPTRRAAIEVIFRYARLMDGSAEYRLEEDGGVAHLILGNSHPLPRHARDFQVGTIFVAATRWLPPNPGAVRVRFEHPAPDDLSAYRATFGDTELEFNAPWDGFAFDAALLDQPLPRADPSLHRVLRQHAERLIADIAPHDDLLHQVRTDIIARLQDGSVDVETTAEKLGMSRRTLARRLREQGTSFSDILEEIRRAMALRYLESTRYGVEEVAFLLGYSSAVAFVRAFRRWLDTSPSEYRRKLMR